MAQRLVADKINTLTHSAGSITLNASASNNAWLTIGGQQYRLTSSISRAISADVTMTAAALYMIYVVRNAGVTELRISSNFNSIGPAGFLSWKLVGAFYSNGVSPTVAFGSFVNIEGVPESGTFDYTPTSGWNTNVTHFGTKKRIGDTWEYLMRVVCSGTPNINNITFNLPATDIIDTPRLVGGTHSYTNHGIVSMQAAGTSYAAGLVGINSTSNLSVWMMRGPAANAHDYTIPSTNNGVPAGPFGAGDFVQVKVTLPIVGLNNTPLKDL